MKKAVKDYKHGYIVNMQVNDKYGDGICTFNVLQRDANGQFITPPIGNVNNQEIDIVYYFTDNLVNDDVLVREGNYQNILDMRQGRKSPVETGCLVVKPDKEININKLLAQMKSEGRDIDNINHASEKLMEAQFDSSDFVL